MKQTTFLAVLPAYLIFLVAAAEAQHCPPIVESYLRQVLIKHDAEDRGIEVKIEYAKSGGQPKEKYQVYWLGYLEKSSSRVPAPPPAELIDKRAVRVLHTQAIERNDRGTYACQWRIEMNELAKGIIELGQLSEKDRQDFGGWGSFKDKFRIAVFIPFLEDATYSVIDGLPNDTHECNYTGARALLFQPLPYSFGIHFGIVQGAQTAKGDYTIYINHTQPIEQHRADDP